MPEIPRVLDAWNLETVRALARVGAPESDRHDFKQDLPDAKTLTKIVCSFANSAGGFLVFGVRPSRAGRWDVRGLEQDPEFAHRFGQKVRVTPSVQWTLPKTLRMKREGRVVHVVHIPASPERPHVPTPEDERFFWKRTNRGCERMTREEIEGQFLRLEERRVRLNQLVAELGHNFQMIKVAHTYKGTPNLDVFDTATIDSLVGDAFSIIATHPQLLQDLQGLRRQFHQINTRRQVFLAELGIGRSIFGLRGDPVDSYNEFVTMRADTVKETINRVLAYLESQLGVARA